MHSRSAQVKEQEEIVTAVAANDSLAKAAYQQKVGAFAATDVVDGETILENEVLYLKIANKGGR